MKLYIIDFSYHIDDEKIYDKWVLACKDDQEVREIMNLNFQEFAKHETTPDKYSFRAITTTDNGYDVTVG